MRGCYARTRRAFVVGILAIAAMPAGAADFSVAVEPAEFFVGDRATARYLLPGGSPLAFELGAADLPQTDKLSLRSLSVRRDASGAVALLVFASYAAGDTALPAIAAKGVSLPAARARTLSVLGPGNPAPSPPAPPVAPPGAALDLALSAALALGAVALVVFVLTAGRRLVARLVEAYRQGLPPRRLLRAAEELEGMSGAASSAAFYQALFAALRPFLGWAAGRDFGPLTRPEMARALDAFPVLLEGAAPILERGDLARFAGREVGAEERRADIAALRGMALRADAEREGGAA